MDYDYSEGYSGDGYLHAPYYSEVYIYKIMYLGSDITRWADSRQLELTIADEIEQD